MRTISQALCCKYLESVQFIEGGWTPRISLGFKCKNLKTFEKAAEMADQKKKEVWETGRKIISSDLDSYLKEKQQLEEEQRYLEQKKKLSSKEQENLKKIEQRIAELSQRIVKNKKLLDQTAQFKPVISAQIRDLTYCRLCPFWEKKA
jgi:tRNA U34 5-methylaminomethyl-2-thiouridine-forming methyltransferase MnmC